MAPPILSTPRSSYASSVDGGGSGIARPPSGGKLTRYTLFVCIAAAFGGLTFGYDIGVSGGVTSNRDFLKMVRGGRLVEGRHWNCWRRGRFVFLSFDLERDKEREELLAANKLSFTGLELFAAVDRRPRW